MSKNDQDDLFGPNPKETRGAWIVHHGRKLALDSNGAAEFPAIDEAAKAATLLTKLGQTEQAEVTHDEVRAIGIASGLNPRFELDGLLKLLERKRLIDLGTSEISLLGVTTRASLSHATDLYNDADPSSFEGASLTLAELASQSPVRRVDISGAIGDRHELTKSQVADFMDRAEDIGFVDKEGDGEDKILFNGNLFRRDSVEKSQKVLSSLKEQDARLVVEAGDLLARGGCISDQEIERVLGPELFEKLVAAGVYDLNQVTNEQGSFVYVTAPAAFHKFVDPMIDDTFDMAKSLVAALSYGMKVRSSSLGRIDLLPRLLGNLISGHEVGPATAIGEDYRVLETNRVLKLRPDARYPNRYHMRLLKKEVGQLALHVLTQGTTSTQALTDLPSAPMSAYVGPERKRVTLRKKQTNMSRRTTLDVLEAVRGGRRLR